MPTSNFKMQRWKNISKNEDEDNAATTTPKLQLIKFHRQILPRISHS